MHDGLQKGNIDLDELVNVLLKEKAEKASAPVVVEEKPAPVAVEEKPAPVVVEEKPAPVVVEEKPAPVMVEEKPAPVVVEKPAPMVEETPAPVVVEEKPAPVAEEKPAPIVEETPAPLVTDEPKKKERRGLFKRREKSAEDVMEEEWADWGLKPIGWTHDEEELSSTAAVEPEPAPAPAPSEPPVVEDISSGRERVEETAQPSEVTLEPPVEKPTAEAATMVIPVVRTTPPTADGATRVIDVSPSAAPAVEKKEIPAEETAAQLPDQLSLEELVRVEDVEDAPLVDEEEEDVEERLMRTRQEKVKEFILGGDEEEENEPEEEVEDFEETEEIDDFTGYDTTEAVQFELQYRWRTSLVSLLLTVGLELLLVLLTFITASLGHSPITSIGYLTAQVFCMILLAVLNYPAVSRGLSGLFSLQANNDTAPAAAVLVAIGGLILHFINLDMPLPVFSPLAGLLLSFNAAAQFVKISRIRENFSFVSYPSVKYSAALIEDEKASAEIGRRVSVEDTARVAYFGRSAFLSDYLKNAYDEDSSDRFARVGAPLAMGLSLVVSLVLLASGRMVDGFWQWMSAFIFMLCLTAFTLQFSLQLPLRATCRRMLRKGGFIVGWRAVDSYGDPDALVVDVADLYPDESMLLHGIKTFSGMHIDAAILDAASLSIRAGGPLSMIFRRIIQNKEDILHEVDSLVYEQGMGLSGWVDGRRVLVGNRRLLQNHGVDVPSSDYEARYAKNGRRLVYLSTAGELSAMFVVSYLADETIGDALHELCRNKVTLLVRSNDPNVTADVLCHDFDLDEYYVDVLPAVAGRIYDQLVAQESESASAVMASNGHILGTAPVLTACRRLRIKSYIALAIHILTALAGLVLCVPWALSTIGTYFLPAFGVMLASALLGWLVPLFKR